jgi:hypothetical protein
MSRSFNSLSSEYLEIDSTPVVAAPLTMACWGYITDTTANRCCMFVGDKDSGSDYWRLDFEGGAAGDPIAFISRGTGGNVNAETSTGFSSGQWHHACGIELSDSSRAVYIDGGSKGTESTTVTPENSDRVSIGRSGDSTPGAYFDGRIAEAALWNAALTDAEVASLAAGYSPLFIRPQSLVAYWPLIRDEDQDRIGGYDLTPFNTPSIASHSPIIYPPLLPLIVSAAAAATVAGKLVNSTRLKSKVGGGLA